MTTTQTNGSAHRYANLTEVLEAQGCQAPYTSEQITNANIILAAQGSTDTKTAELKARRLAAEKAKADPQVQAKVAAHKEAQRQQKADAIQRELKRDAAAEEAGMSDSQKEQQAEILHQLRQSVRAVSIEQLRLAMQTEVEFFSDWTTVRKNGQLVQEDANLPVVKATAQGKCWTGDNKVAFATQAHADAKQRLDTELAREDGTGGSVDAIERAMFWVQKREGQLAQALAYQRTAYEVYASRMGEAYVPKEKTNLPASARMIDPKRVSDVVARARALLGKPVVTEGRETTGVEHTDRT